VRTDVPLTLGLTEEAIEGHRPPRERTPGEGPDPRTGAEHRLGIARALLSAHDRLRETVQIVADAESEDAAVRGIRKLLDCGADAAQAVYMAPLRRFTPRHRAGLEEEVEALERELRRLDGSGA
jgi:hypothetical protein